MQMQRCMEAIADIDDTETDEYEWFSEHFGQYVK